MIHPPTLHSVLEKPRPCPLDSRLATGVILQNQDTTHYALAGGANPNLFLPSSTLLAKDCALGKPDIVKALIDARADVNSTGTPGWESPLCSAIKMRHMNIVETLIDARADVNQPSGAKKERPLEAALSVAHARMTYRLLIAGAHVHTFNPVTNSTPLIQACRTNQSLMVSALLTFNADPNFCADTPPLFSAIPNPKIVKTLLESRADPRWTVRKGENVGTQAIHLAAMSGSAESARLLLEAGISPHTLDVKFRRPYDIALEYLEAAQKSVACPKREKMIASFQKTVEVLKPFDPPDPSTGIDPGLIFGNRT